MTKEELLAAFPHGVGRAQVAMLSWHRKRGADEEPDTGWGRFWDDAYDGWEGFYIPPPDRPKRVQGVVRVLSGRAYWGDRRTATRAKS